MEAGEAPAINQNEGTSAVMPPEVQQPEQIQLRPRLKYHEVLKYKYPGENEDRLIMMWSDGVNIDTEVVAPDGTLIGKVNWASAKYEEEAERKIGEAFGRMVSALEEGGAEVTRNLHFSKNDEGRFVLTGIEETSPEPRPSPTQKIEPKQGFASEFMDPMFAEVGVRAEEGGDSYVELGLNGITYLTQEAFKLDPLKAPYKGVEMSTFRMSLGDAKVEDDGIHLPFNATASRKFFGIRGPERGLNGEFTLANSSGERGIIAQDFRTNPERLFGLNTSIFFKDKVGGEKIQEVYKRYIREKLGDRVKRVDFRITDENKLRIDFFASLPGEEVPAPAPPLEQSPATQQAPVSEQPQAPPEQQSEPSGPPTTEPAAGQITEEPPRSNETEQAAAEKMTKEAFLESYPNLREYEVVSYKDDEGNLQYSIAWWDGENYRLNKMNPDGKPGERIGSWGRAMVENVEELLNKVKDSTFRDTELERNLQFSFDTAGNAEITRINLRKEATLIKGEGKSKLRYQLGENGVLWAELRDLNGKLSVIYSNTYSGEVADLEEAERLISLGIDFLKKKEGFDVLPQEEISLPEARKTTKTPVEFFLGEQDEERRRVVREVVQTKKGEKITHSFYRLGESREKGWQAYSFTVIDPGSKQEGKPPKYRGHSPLKIDNPDNWEEELKAHLDKIKDKRGWSSYEFVDFSPELEEILRDEKIERVYISRKVHKTPGVKGGSDEGLTNIRKRFQELFTEGEEPTFEKLAQQIEDQLPEEIKGVITEADLQSEKIEELYRDEEVVGTPLGDELSQEKQQSVSMASSALMKVLEEVNNYMNQTFPGPEENLESLSDEEKEYLNLENKLFKLAQDFKDQLGAGDYLWAMRLARQYKKDVMEKFYLFSLLLMK